MAVANISKILKYANKFNVLANDNIITSLSDPPKSSRKPTQNELLEYHFNRLLAQDVTEFAEDALDQVDTTTLKDLLEKTNEIIKNKESDHSPEFNFKSVDVADEPKEPEMPSIQHFVEKTNEMNANKPKELEMPSVQYLVDRANEINKVIEDREANSSGEEISFESIEAPDEEVDFDPDEEFSFESVAS